MAELNDLIVIVPGNTLSSPQNLVRTVDATSEEETTIFAAAFIALVDLRETLREAEEKGGHS